MTKRKARKEVKEKAAPKKLAKFEEIEEEEKEENEVEVASLQRIAAEALSEGASVKAERAFESCWEILRNTDQEGRWPSGIRDLASRVASETVCETRNGAVSLWASSCGVEMLRIFAPQSPFGAEECGRFFKMIARQLRDLDSHKGTPFEGLYLTQARHIIDSLRGFQSVIILAEAATASHQAEEALVELVDASFGACREDFGPELCEACLDVACLLIAEASGGPKVGNTPPQLLEAVLATLLPTARADSPVAHEAARLAVLRLQDVLARPISRLLEACFLAIQTQAAAAESPEGDSSFVKDTNTRQRDCNERNSHQGSIHDDESEDNHNQMNPPWLIAREQPSAAYALVYELHLISSQLIAPSLCHLADLMTSETEKCREAGATLFGRLCADKARYYARFEDLYDSWLRRFVDSSPQVRAHMVKVGLKVAASCADAKLAKQLQSKAAERLDDPDHRVRRAAVHAVANALHDDLADHESMSRALGERIMDKRPEIRTDALTGLAAIFAKHHKDYVLDWIPRLILRSYAAQCNAGTEVQQRARLLLDTKIASCLELADCLDPDADDYGTAVQALELLLRTHATHQRQLNAYLDKREAMLRRTSSRGKRKSSSIFRSSTTKRSSPSDSDEDDDDEDLRTELDSAEAALAALVPGSKSGWARSLTAVKDGKVFKALRLVADAASTKTIRLEAKTEAVSRLSALDIELGRRVESVLNGSLDLAVDAEGLRSVMTDHSANIIAPLVLVVAKQHPKLLAAVGASAVNTYAQRAASQRDDADEVNAAAMAISALIKADPLCAEKMRTAAAAMCKLALEASDESFAIESSKHAADACLSLDQQSSFAAQVATFKYRYDTPGLVARLKVLGRVALRNGTETLSECLEDIDTNLIAHAPAQNGNRKKKGTASVYGAAFRGQQFSARFLALCAAIKAQSYAVLGDAKRDTDLRQRGRLAAVLFGILENKGEPPGKPQCKPTERAELRRLAASQALKLATRHAAFAQTTTPPRWRLLCSLVIDESASVSTSFGRKLAKLIQSRSDEPGIFAKWAPALAVLHPDDAVALKAARRALLVGVRRARADYARRLACADSTQEDAIARGLLPEYALPYAIHLLARLYSHTFSDNDTNDDGSQLPMAKPVARALTTLFDALTNGLDANAHNVAFLLRCCAEIVASSSADSSGSRKHDARLAAQAADLLKVKYVTTQAALAPFPGNIFLPSSLYPQTISTNATSQRLAQNIFNSYEDDNASRRSSASIRGIHFSARRQKQKISPLTTGSKMKKRRTSEKAFDSGDDSDDGYDPGRAASARPLRDRDTNSSYRKGVLISPISDAGQ